jgi:hypothetical protein
MAKERSEKRRMEKAILQGRENAALWPRIEAWCRHLEIKMLSAGMLAKAYQLARGSPKREVSFFSGRYVKSGVTLLIL